MTRERVPKGQIFLKSEQKILSTLNKLDPVNSDDDFILKFKELYPDDWRKIITRYEAHERITPAGKSHPMAPPPKYLLSIASTHRARYAKGEISSLAKSGKGAASD